MTFESIPRRDFLRIAAPASFTPAILFPFSACHSPMKSAHSDRTASTPPIITALSHQPFRILQVTDIHFFGDTPEQDQRTIGDLHALIRHWQPDLIMMTGDLWHDNPDGRGREFCEWSAARMAELNVPWAFAWGNHDLMDDFSHGHTIFENAPHCHYSRGDGYGNYRIEIQDRDSGKPIWQLYVMNSYAGGLTRRERHWIQVETEHINEVPGIAFFHIPVYQYKTLWEEGRAHGIKHEEVCFEHERGTALPVIAKTNRIQAVFVGHDHVNDFAGIDSGVELVYGRATGYGGYGGEQVEKGAKLIELNPEKGNYSHQTVFADGRVWQPNTS